MKRLLLKLSIVVLFFSFVSTTGGCSGGGYSHYKYQRFQTHRKHSRAKSRYIRNRHARHYKPLSKDYIIKNKRRDRGW